jgi:hypothetical protein
MVRLPKGYVCYRAARPPDLNGRLDDPVWSAAPWTEDFTDIEGDRRPRPRFRTRAKMLWDDDCFYIAAELEEPCVWATLTRHDSVIFNDNDFEVFIDPDGDNHNYYEIEINALNTTWDLRLPKPYRDGGPPIDAWECDGLRTAVHVDGKLNDPSVTDRGWTVEMALPWKALGEYATCPAPPRDGDRWRVNFSRVEWDVAVEDGRIVKVPGRKEHNWVWSPQGVVDMHQPEQWGYVQFTTRTSGDVPFVRDPDEGVKRRLMTIYHSQVAFRKRHGVWAASIDDLGLGSDVEPSPVITRDETGWAATLPGSTGRWRVRADSLITPA